MPDPTSEAPAWLVWLLGAGASGTSAYGMWQFVNARLQASKAEARAERKAATAEAAENDIIRTLREALAEERRQRSEDVALLRAQMAECQKEIAELRSEIDKAYDARFQAMREAANFKEQNAALQAKLDAQAHTITTQQADASALTATYAELSEFVCGLELPAEQRAAAAYVKASAWLLNGRSKLVKEPAA